MARRFLYQNHPGSASTVVKKRSQYDQIPTMLRRERMALIGLLKKQTNLGVFYLGYGYFAIARWKCRKLTFLG